MALVEASFPGEWLPMCPCITVFPAAVIPVEGKSDAMCETVSEAAGGCQLLPEKSMT